MTLFIAQPLMRKERVLSLMFKQTSIGERVGAQTQMRRRVVAAIISQEEP